MTNEKDSGRRDFLGYGAAAAGVVALAAAAIPAAAGEAAGQPGEAGVKSDPPVCNKMTVTDGELTELIKLAEGLGARPLGWCAYGQPAADTVCGTIELPKDKLAEFTTKFGAWQPRLPRNIGFPYGIPANFDRILVSVRAGRDRSEGR